MSKIAVIADSHLGVGNDDERFFKQAERFFTETFFPTIKARKIRYIIHCGDVVHKRSGLSFNAMKRIEEMFLQPLSKLQVNVCFIAGNHDVSYKNTNSVNVLAQFLEPMKLSTDYFHFVWEKPEDIEVNGHRICLCPWITNDNEDASLQHLSSTKARTVFGHFELKGFAQYRGHLATHGRDPAFLSRFENVYSGHYHTKSTQGNITYLGSPYQMNWADEGDERGFHIFDTQTHELEFVANPHKQFLKVASEDQVVGLDVGAQVRVMGDLQIEGENLNIQYIEPPKVKMAEELSIVSGDSTLDILKAAVAGLALPQNDGDRLSTYMTTLYNEALNVE